MSGELETGEWADTIVSVRSITSQMIGPSSRLCKRTFRVHTHKKELHVATDAALIRARTMRIKDLDP
jgi:hypothetical protein